MRLQHLPKSIPIILELAQENELSFERFVQTRTESGADAAGWFLRRVDISTVIPLQSDAWNGCGFSVFFGSLMRGEDKLGDIDALETTWRPEDLAAYAGRQFRTFCRAAAKSQPSFLIWLAETWMTRRAIYGARRHPFLAIVQRSCRAASCRLNCERATGGHVGDPISSSQPQLNGRQNNLVRPREMPDFTPSPQR